MDVQQQTAEAAFAAFSVPAVYNAGAGNIPCRVIDERGTDQLAGGLVPARRIEFSVLISEVGDYQPNATIEIGSITYVVRDLTDDDGYVRRLLVGRQ